MAGEHEAQDEQHSPAAPERTTVRQCVKISCTQSMMVGDIDNLLKTPSATLLTAGGRATQAKKA
jgi:hypothetical protein